MLYISTNKQSKPVDFKTALLTGQAPDGGLYIPEHTPQLDPGILEKIRKENLAYHEIGNIVLQPFLDDEIDENTLSAILKDAYNFPMPVSKIDGYENTYVFYQDRGPTAAFKDFAARLMSRLMNHFLANEKKKITILVATSGDTGGAVADAFNGLANIDVVVLFPLHEVSPLQKKQLTQPRSNVLSIAVDGKFDNCQAFVKKAFTDPDLVSKFNFSSANSINIGRLLPQCLYYFYVYSKIAEKEGEEFIVSVPSGNFGNLCGGLIAKKMGVPIKKFVAAVNENDEFPRFLETHEYHPLMPSKNCLSSAMNIGNPNNLCRIAAWYSGNMDTHGTLYTLPDMQTLSHDIFSASISDEETKAEIRYVYDKYNLLIDPHGAVGFKALERLRDIYPEFRQYKSVVFETANPAKFSETMEEILHFKPEIPENLKNLDSQEEKYETIGADYGEFKTRLLK